MEDTWARKGYKKNLLFDADPDKYCLVSVGVYGMFITMW
jgi:hypothetical protein